MNTESPVQKDDAAVGPQASPQETPKADAENAAPTDSRSVDVPPAEPLAEPEAPASPEPASPVTETPPEEPPLPPRGNETPTVRGSLAARCFNGLAAVGPLVLILFWIVQSLPVLMGREPQGLDALATGLLGGVAANGFPSPDFYPVYHWFLTALNALPGLDAFSLAAWLPGVQPTAGLEQFVNYPTALLPLASALSTLCLILLTWGLARAAGNDRRTALASGLVLLTSLALMGLPRVAGSDMLFASILTLSGLCLYKGWIKSFAPLWLSAGFALAALSTLAGGLMGLVLPLLTSLVFLLWRGTFRRAGARDGALAFGLMLILLLAWGTFTAFQDGGRDLLKTLLENEYLGPLAEGWKVQGRDAWLSVALLAVLWLPWTALLLFLPWGKSGTFFKAILVNRSQRPGQGWIWCSLIMTLAVLAGLGANMTILLIPALPPLAILTAQGLLALSARGSRGFFLLIAVALLFLGLAFAAAHFYPFFFGVAPAPLANLQPVQLPLVAALIQIGGLIVIALLLWKGVNRGFSSGTLLVLTFLMLLYTAPLAYYMNASASTSAPADPTKETVASPVETPAAPAMGETSSPTPRGEQVAPMPAAPEQAPAMTEPEATPLPVPDSPAEPSTSSN